MPDHLHLVIELGDEGLPVLVNRIKAITAKAANKALQRRGSIWSRAYHDHALRESEGLIDMARYVIANPVRAGLVPSVRDYPFWNAAWL